MKFKQERPFPSPEAAEKKLLELANAIEADHAGRLSVAVINRRFREAGGSYEEYGKAVNAAIEHDWITMHPSGGYLSFTQAGGGPDLVVNVRFAAYSGLKSDIARGPKSATSRLMQRCNTLCYSITSSARATSDCGLSGRAPSQS